MADQVSEGLLSPFLQRQRLNAARPFLKGRVLDIGCGNGALTEFCLPESYYGYDYDAATLAVARATHPKFRFEQDFPNNELFDTVVGLAIIEHLPRPAEDMRKWASFLDQNGSLVLTTPHPSLEWAHEFGSRIGLFSAGAAEEHEQLINRKLMEGLAEEAGLVVGTYRRFLFGANQLFVLKRG